MADVNKTNVAEPSSTNPAPEPDPNAPVPATPEPEKPATPGPKPEPTAQDLMIELAKVKRAQEKAASEAAEYKKKWKESLSEVEKASMEKAEKEAEREEQFNRLLRENRLNRVEKGFLTMGYTADEAARMAAAEVDGDFEAKTKIMAEVDARKRKEWEADFIKSRPNVNIGMGGGKEYTKEQFDKMNLAERTKLFREDKAEYDRLKGLA